MPMNTMGTTCWFSLAKVFYGIRKKKKILTLLPSSLTKNETSSLFPDMIHDRIYKSEKSCTRKKEFILLH